MTSARAGENTDQSRRQDSRSEGDIGRDRDPPERLLLPVANETNAEDTCTAVRPYVDPCHSEIVAVHVVEQTTGFPDKLPPAVARERAEATCRIVRDNFADADCRVATEVRYGPNVAEEIIDTARAIDAKAIGFTPRQGSRWLSMLTGDVGYRLVTSSHRPVVVFPRSPTPRRPVSETEGHTPDDRLFGAVVLPIVSTRHAESSFRAVLPYLSSESRVVVLHIIRRRPEGSNHRSYAIAQARKRGAQQLLESVSEWFERAGISTATRLEYADDVVDAIDEVAAEEEADAVAFTPRVVTRWKRLLSGDTADELIRRSGRPVIVLPVRDEDEYR